MNASAVARDPPVLPEARFQSAYARLLTDASYRDAVFSGRASPAAVTDGGEIESRLRSMDVGRTTMFAELLLGNRVAAISEAFPATAVLLGQGLPAIARRFGEEMPPQDHRKYPEACAFASYLGETLDRQPFGPACLPDVLAYEMAKLRLRYEYRLPFWPDAAALSSSEFAAASSDGTPVYVLQHPYLALLSFAHDVAAICESIAVSGAPPAAHAQPTTLLLYMGPEGDLRQDAVNAATAAFLLLVDGRTTFDEVVRQFAELCDCRDADTLARLRKTAGELCGQLLQRGVVAFQSEPLSLPAS